MTSYDQWWTEYEATEAALVKNELDEGRRLDEDRPPCAPDLHEMQIFRVCVRCGALDMDHSEPVPLDESEEAAADKIAELFHRGIITLEECLRSLDALRRET